MKLTIDLNICEKIHLDRFESSDNGQKIWEKCIQPKNLSYCRKEENEQKIKRETKHKRDRETISVVKHKILNKQKIYNSFFINIYTIHVNTKQWFILSAPNY